MLTNEPVQCTDDAWHIVECYRARWLIEEFFKAIKTGCRYEQFQLESIDALKRLFAFYLPIAWHMLALRYLAHHAPDVPAHHVLGERRVRLVRKIMAPNLPLLPSLQQVLFALAAYGGHLKRNGPPGWLTLLRGYLKLLDYEIVFTRM